MASYDMSGLVLLNATLGKMIADQAATPQLFGGGASFNASYSRVSGTNAVMLPTTTATMNTRALRSAILDLLDQVNQLNLSI